VFGARLSKLRFTRLYFADQNSRFFQLFFHALQLVLLFHYGHIAKTGLPVFQQEHAVPGGGTLFNLFGLKRAFRQVGDNSVQGAQLCFAGGQLGGVYKGAVGVLVALAPEGEFLPLHVFLFFVCNAQYRIAIFNGSQLTNGVICHSVNFCSGKTRRLNNDPNLLRGLPRFQEQGPAFQKV
jgi:hypothetical protein